MDSTFCLDSSINPASEMRTRAAATSCTEHVLNIQPNQDEAWAFHGFDVTFLEPEVSWPPLLLNYIHRWMHRHSLYNVCPAKAGSFSKLIDSLMLRTNLPTTEPIRSTLVLKCRSLIKESALKWKNESLLVQRGSGFRKHKQLEAAWAAHEDWFKQAETVILGSTPVGERAKGGTTMSATADDGGGKKRGANTSLAESSTKKLRTDDHCAHEGGDRVEAILRQPHNSASSNLSGSDRIIVDVGETALPEPGRSECGSPSKPCLDGIPNQVHSNSIVESSRAPSPQQPHGESSSVQAVHIHVSSPIHQLPLFTVASTIHETTSHPNESKDSTAVLATLSQQPPSCENSSGVTDTTQAYMQQIEAVHQQAATALPNATGPGDAALLTCQTIAPPSTPPKSAILGSPRMMTLSMDGQISPTQAPKPASGYMSSPPRSSPDAPNHPVSPDLKHSTPESTTAPQLTLGAEVQIQQPLLRPRYQGYPSQVPKPTTLEPFAYGGGGGPPSTIAPTLQLNSPTHNSKCVLPRSLDRSGTHARVGTTDSIAPAQGNTHHSVAPDPTYVYEVATLAARRGQRTTASQSFRSIGKLLVPKCNQSRKGFTLHVNALMSQSVTEFYAQFLGLLEEGTYVSVLRFELLDLIPRPGPEQSNWSICISYNDQANFQALQKFVFNSFVASMSERPSLNIFRILITSPNLLPSNNNNTESRLVSRSMPSQIQPHAITFPPGNPFTSSVHDPAVSQTYKGHGLNPPRTVQGPEQNVATRNSPCLFPQIIVRIQVDGSRRVSRLYPRAILSLKVKNIEFFTWFAKETGFGDPMGPPELMFSFKDAFPAPKNNLIARGNEEHFEYMKRDIKPMCEHAAVCMPDLTEFAILITVPRWVTETDEEW